MLLPQRQQPLYISLCLALVVACYLFIYSSLKMPFYRLQMAAMLMKPSQQPINNTYLPTTTINGTPDFGSFVSHFQQSPT
jgi:hypothetical protein